MRYVQSKLANMLYADQVAKHFPQFTTISLHPGEVGTALFSREPGDEQIRYLQKEVVPTRIVPVDEGVKNQLWAVAAAGLVSGAYYEPVGVLYQEKLLENHVKMAEELWESTEKELEGQGV